jgi:two-component system KDP operon response regulator KdpE
MTAAGPHVLLVEDDGATRSSVAANLAAHGYRIAEAGDVRSAMASWELGRPDIILLDLGLPDADGLILIRHVRRDATTPILVLTARDAEADKVTALESGADDYVTKPFGLPELRARIGALLRRAGGPGADPAGHIALGPVVIDVGRRSVTVAGVAVDLTPREYELLKTMISQPGRLLTRGRLLRAVWGAAYGDEAHYLHVYVSRIRRKLDAADPTGAASALIAAEPGLGYRIAEAAEDAG